MKLAAGLIALFALVTLPISLAPNDKVDMMAYAQVYGPRVAAPPHYVPGRVFNSQGGYLREFRGLKAQMRRHGGLVRLGHCASACTTLLSLPNACVEPWGTFMFHAARFRNPFGQEYIDVAGTNEMFRQVPPSIRGLLRPPFDGLNQVLSGAQLIAAGARPCPY